MTEGGPPKWLSRLILCLSASLVLYIVYQDFNDRPSANVEIKTVAAMITRQDGTVILIKEHSGGLKISYHTLEEIRERLNNDNFSNGDINDRARSPPKE
jgi:hypothetical protein